jgi:hypothetical protein
VSKSLWAVGCGLWAVGSALSPSYPPDGGADSGSDGRVCSPQYRSPDSSCHAVHVPPHHHDNRPHHRSGNDYPPLPDQGAHQDHRWNHGGRLGTQTLQTPRISGVVWIGVGADRHSRSCLHPIRLGSEPVGCHRHPLARPGGNFLSGRLCSCHDDLYNPTAAGRDDRGLSGI